MPRMFERTGRNGMRPVLLLIVAIAAAAAAAIGVNCDEPINEAPQPLDGGAGNQLEVKEQHDGPLDVEDEEATTASDGDRAIELQELTDELHANKVPVLLSERKLRASIANLNEDLRDLKRHFIEDVSRIYLKIGLDKKVGRAGAKRGRVAALAMHLAAEEFGEILIKKHITERRLLSGLKAAFVKLLPLATIKRLMSGKHRKSFSWLRGASHFDIRPRFEGADELQFAQIYELISLRARLRAADDVVALTSENIKRILNVAHDFLIDREKFSIDTVASELRAMAGYLPAMLQYYLNQVIVGQQNLAKAYGEQFECAGHLSDLAGGDEQLLKVMDEIIDSVGLDIDLSRAANSLNLPPTIDETIIENIERKWMPRMVLDSMSAERELMLRNRRDVSQFLAFNSDQFDSAELSLTDWLEAAVSHIQGKSYD